MKTSCYTNHRHRDFCEHENFVEAQRQNSIIVMHPPFQFCSLYISKNTGTSEDISLAGDANVFWKHRKMLGPNLR